MTRGYDTIIVGGGAAGCVLANRLSAHSSRSVLLLEAGRDTLPGQEPADVLSVAPLSYFNNAYKWPLDAHMRTRETSPPVRISQARIMGGGSTVMGMVAVRGTPDDYEEWEGLGARGWAWKDVLPFFRRLETDIDFQDEWHGDNGPTVIRRHRRADWPPLSRAAEEYFAKRQMPVIADMNGDFRDGLCAVPMAATADKRQSSAICYLDAVVRQRPNLRIEAGATVSRLLFEGRRTIGVEVEVLGRRESISGREILLSAGALHTPAILMRAGIGPAAHLKEHGIDVLADLPGVGANLQNHVVLFFCALLKRGAEQSPRLQSQNNTSLRFSSNLPGCPPSDMYGQILSKTSWHALGRKLATLTTVLHKPASRGRVSLRSPQASDQPLIEFNYLSDERDLPRLVRGARTMADLAASDEFAPLCHNFYPVFLSDRLRKLNQPTRANALKAQAVATLLDVAPWLANRVGAMIGGSIDLATLAADRERLEAHIVANVAGAAHYAGTCRMGNPYAKETVVDSAGRVLNVGGLRVADASVMPSVPRGNTNIPTLMLAEKLAEAIAEDS